MMLYVESCDVIMWGHESCSKATTSTLMVCTKGHVLECGKIHLSCYRGDDRSSEGFIGKHVGVSVLLFGVLCVYECFVDFEVLFILVAKKLKFGSIVLCDFGILAILPC